MVGPNRLRDVGAGWKADVFMDMILNQNIFAALHKHLPGQTLITAVDNRQDCLTDRGRQGH